MRNTFTWSCVLLLLSSHAVAAQALHPASLFERMVGHWLLRGTIARRQTTHDVTVPTIGTRPLSGLSVPSHDLDLRFRRGAECALSFDEG